MNRLKSDIPPGAVEQLVSEYRQENRQQGTLIYYRTVDCILNGQVVGRRYYTPDGTLVMETPLKDGRKHGREFTWSEDGMLLSVEPYVKGKIHGTVKQYGFSGKPIGSYRLIHGTGFDIWRSERIAGRVTISEIHSLQDGLPHGYEWWFTDDGGSLWHERHWRAGTYNGIERMWNSHGKLKRGYPKYWIMGQTVAKRKYIQAAKSDQTLPVFREQDNSPQRKFPVEIEKLLSSR
jgi:antitoxin component YwqK of YwqJK toxin-antitoxin module